MGDNDNWVKVRKRNHPGTKTLQRMLWLVLLASIPYGVIHVVLGHYVLTDWHLLGSAVLLFLLTQNKDSRLSLTRKITGTVLILYTTYFTLVLGIDSWAHLVFLLNMFGLLQAFTFARRNPWLARFQVANLTMLIVTLVISRTGIVEPYVKPEESTLYAIATLALVAGVGLYLIILNRKSANRHFQSAAIEASEFMRIVDNSPHAIIIVDAQTHSLFHGNDKYKKLFEFDKLPNHLSELIRPALRTSDFREIANTIDAEGQFTTVKELETTKGKKVTCSLVISRIRIGQNQCNLIRIRDISDEVKIKKSLDRVQERLELALLASMDGIWEWNLETGEVYLSPRWKEMFGYKDHELDNSYEAWRKVIFKEDEARSSNMLMDFLKQKRDDFFVTERYHHKEGSTVYVESRAVRVIGSNGRTQKLVGSHTDITQLVAAQQQLEEAIEAANAASEAKSQFLANMSHEIRTPLASILSFADQLLDEDLPEKVRELVSIIHTSGETLNQLLQDILDFERIRKGKLTLKNEPFDPGQTVRNLKKLYGHKANEKALQFIDEIAWEDGVQVMGDELRFKQILSNLLDNAFKFTERGGVRISMYPGKEGGEDILYACVTDSGPGIDPDFHDSIFEIFTQYDPSLRRKHSGSGLGLGIVKELVGLMNGRIQLESPPEDPFPGYNQGARFIFSMPVNLIEGEQKAPSRPVGEKLRFPQRTVLLAEDNPLNQRIASHALIKFGLEVITAKNGVEAVSKVQQHKDIALVLMDIHMPEMNGYEASEMIKKMRPDLPVIGLSANAYPKDIERSQKVGMSGYLPKPYSKEELFVTLEPFLG
jgi:PAS domain S-box-containing protein